MTIRFHIDQATLKTTLTADDIETMELFREGEEVGSYRIKRMAARFMVTEDNQPIPYKQALKVFGSLTAEDYGETLKKFIEAMTDTALPKANGTPSASPSAASSPAASQDGSQP